MPTLQITNFRGISSGKLSLHPLITLIAGRNGNGKTSTLQALGCLLTGSASPVAGVPKKYNHQLVHKSSGTANISLDNYSISFPDGKPNGTRSYISSEYASGVKSVADISADELSSLIQIEPTQQDLDQELSSYPGFTREYIDHLWDYISKQGWDATYSRAKDEGTELKAEWRHITGEQYGHKKAESWTPEHYDRTKDESELLDGITEAKHLHEQAIAQRAVADHEREKYQQLADDLDNALAKLPELKQNMDATAEALKISQETLSALPKVTNCALTYDCPSCQKTLTLKNGELTIHDGKQPTRKQVKQALDRIEQQNECIRMAEKLRNDAMSAYNAASAYANDCRKARTALDAATNTPYVDPDASKKLVEVLQEKLDALKKYRLAYEIHEKLARNTYLQSVLCPDGVRKQVLAARLSGFNQALSNLSAAAEWQTVSLEELDLTPMYGGRPYRLLSESEKFRVRATIQTAIAHLDGSAYVCIDAADILDSDGRNGLINMLLAGAAKLPAVIAMTFSSRSDAPDLTAAEIGATFWVDGGVVRALSATPVTA
jgi:hypothetical protein